MSDVEKVIGACVQAPLQTPLAATATLASARMRAWAVKGGAAAFEQGFFAGSHFLLNVILARSLSPDAYGAFAFSGTVFLVVIGFYNALLLEPAAVLDVSRYEPRPGAYCRAQLFLHAAFSVLAGGCVATAGLIVLNSSGAGHLGPTLVAAGLTCPFTLLFWLARRFLYILGRPGTALAGSASYLLCICSSALMLHEWALLTPVTAFGSIAIGATISATVMLWRIGVFAPEHPGGSREFETVALMTERWRYGRWLIAVVLVEIAIAPAMVLMTASMLGLAAVGILRAMQTFVLPLGHVVIAITGLALPAFARDFQQQRFRALARKSRMLAGMLVTAALTVEALLITFHPALERILFDGKFADYSFLIPLFGLVTVFESLALSYTAVLSAVRHPELIFRSVMITAPLSLAVGWFGISQWGLQGAVLSFTAAAAISAAAKRSLAARWLADRQEAG